MDWPGVSAASTKAGGMADSSARSSASPGKATDAGAVAPRGTDPPKSCGIESRPVAGPVPEDAPCELLSAVPGRAEKYSLARRSKTAVSGQLSGRRTSLVLMVLARFHFIQDR